LKGMSNKRQRGTPTVRVRGLSDLIHLVPSMLGFHPEESLVVVCLDEGRVAVTARADLARLTCADDIDDCFGALWDRYPSCACVVIAFSTDAEAAWSVVEDFIGELPADVWVDAAHVDGHAWFDAPFGVAHRYDPPSSAVAAEAAYWGVNVLPDRGSLAATLQPVISRPEMDQALARVIAIEPTTTVASALDVLASLSASPRPPSAHEASMLAVAAFSPAFADVVVGDIEHRTAGGVRALWTDVVRRVPPFAGGMAAVFVGMAAWVSGDGALVNVCLERAVDSAGGNQWFRFLEIAARVALPPSQWDEVRTELVRGRAA